MIKSYIHRNAYNPSMKVPLLDRIHELIQALQLDVQKGITWLGLDLRSTNILSGTEQQSLAEAQSEDGSYPALRSWDINWDLTLEVHIAGVRSQGLKRIFPTANSYWVYTIRPIWSDQLDYSVKPIWTIKPIRTIQWVHTFRINQE